MQSIDLEVLGAKLKRAVADGKMTEKEAFAEYNRVAGMLAKKMTNKRKGQYRSFYSIVIGRLKSKEIELGEFTLDVDYVTSIYGDRRLKDTIIGKTVKVVGIAGPWLDKLLLIKRGETLKLCSGTLEGTIISLSPKATVLEGAAPFDPETYPIPPESFRGFQGVVVGTIESKSECHKHPFDKWTQQDFNDFTRFFEDVHSRGHIGFPQFAAAQAGQVVDWPEMFLGKSAEKTMRLLRSRQVTIPADKDPRQPLMQWMREQDNPWFARAFVNRVWAGYFHVGIVDPPDQFTPANPPSNPQLLDWLTTGFIESGYDMKWIHRQIASSETYQRSWKPNESNRHDRRNFSRAIPRRIPAEVVYDAMKQLTAANDELAVQVAEEAT